MKVSTVCYRGATCESNVSRVTWPDETPRMRGEPGESIEMSR